MNNEKLFNDIFNLLDPELQSDHFFQVLKELFFKYINEQFDSITVDSQIAECLEEFHYDTNYEETDLTILEAIGDNISFSITKMEDKFLVEIKLTTNNQSINILFLKHGSFNRIEKTIMAINDGWYTDFDVDIKYYNNYYELPITVWGEKDYVFSKTFNIPERLAHYFRLNFKKVAPILKEYQESGNLDSFEHLLSKSDYTYFLRPFNPPNFNDAIKNEYRQETADILEDILECNDEIDNLNTIPLNKIQSLLLSAIGYDGQIIMSKNIYQSILLYLMNYTNDLSTKGIIIKKVADTYTLFLISLNNNEIISMPISLTKDDALKLSESNPLNNEIPELQDFFQSRGR